MNRRELLQSGIAVGALPLAATNAWARTARPAPTTSCVSLYSLVVDERFAESRAFGDEAVRLGARVQRMRGDITHLWYDDLYPRWRQERAAIAGLTAHGPLFCLEQLARDVRMRVIFRAQHRRALDGSFEHRIEGGEGVRALAATVRPEAGDWSVDVARLVMNCPAESGVSANALILPARCALVGDESAALFSWVIA